MAQEVGAVVGDEACCVVTPVDGSCVEQRPQAPDVGVSRGDVVAVGGEAPVAETFERTEQHVERRSARGDPVEVVVRESVLRGG